MFEINKNMLANIIFMVAFSLLAATSGVAYAYSNKAEAMSSPAFLAFHKGMKYFREASSELFEREIVFSEEKHTIVCSSSERNLQKEITKEEFLFLEEKDKENCWVEKKPTSQQLADSVF